MKQKVAFYKIHMDGTHRAYGSYEVHPEKHVTYWRWIISVIFLTMAVSITSIAYKTYASVEPVKAEVPITKPVIAPEPVSPTVAPVAVPPLQDKSSDLSQKLESWSVAQTGSEWGFYVRSLDSNTLNVGLNSSKQFDMASIYKLFIIKPLADKKPAEAWANNQIIGKSYQECVRLMLAVSDNPCAESLAGVIGWSKAQQQISADGYSNTIINDVSKFVSSTEDTGLLLERLYEAEGFDAKTKEIALNAMGQYKRTEAIRRACDGCQVMNKTGDLAGAKHDAGIVVKDGKAYVVVIFSKGASWNQLIQASQLITAEL